MRNKLKWKKWNAYDGDVDEVWECPECEFELLLSEGDPWDNEYYFCPKCGADLREKTKKKSKIKPCPFCGGEAHIYQDEAGGHYLTEVICNDCKVGLERWGKTSKEQAVEAWNRRTD